MTEHRLGRSDVAIGPLGLGTAPLGNLYQPMSDADAYAIVHHAVAIGIDYADTAPHYGLGLSEMRLGAGLSGHPHVVVSTKVGRVLERATPEPAGDDDLANGFAVTSRWERRWDFSASGVRRSLADSRQRIGRERIDIAYLHDPDDHMEQALAEALPELVALRDAGAVGAIGAGMNSAEHLQRFVATGLLDVVLLAGRYTLLEQGPSIAMLDAAESAGTSVVIGGVFNSGLLAASTVPDCARYNYAPAPAALIDRARHLAAVCARFDTPLPAAAVQFPFGHPAVACVLVGVSSTRELSEDHAAMKHPIPAELWVLTAGVLRLLLENAEGAALTYGPVGVSGSIVAPSGFRRDHWVRRLGYGDRTFDATVEAIQTWKVHRGAGLVLCVDGPPAVGLDVAMSAPLPIGYVDAVCRVVAVIEEPDRFGFAYGTLPTHPERGEESFVVARKADGTVDFEVTAVSQPRHPLARLCPPLARRLQRSATTRYLDAVTTAVAS